MNKPPVNLFNVTHCDAVGVSKARLHHQSIQVCHLADGNAVLTFGESGRDSVMFDLTPAQCQHLAGLLVPHAAQPVAQGI